MEDLKNCPTCNSELKSGTFSSNELKAPGIVKAINTFTEHKDLAFCDKCGNPAFQKATQNRVSMMRKNNDQLQSLINLVPVITLQNPFGWDYELVKVVTAQSVTGEGALTEFSSSWAEFFGTQSNRLNNKLKNGENICFSKIRLDAVMSGANAVIGLDIDYAEVGGAKGMLMVCMSGTGVRLNNLEVLKQVGTTENFLKLEDTAKLYVLYNSLNPVFQ